MLTPTQRPIASRVSAHAGDAGYALLMVLVIVAVLLTIGASTIRLVRSELRSTADHVAYQGAFYVAEAGVQRGLAQLNSDRDMASTYTTYSFNGAPESFADGSYVVTIGQDPQFPADPTRKLITSTGTRFRQSAEIVAHAVVQPVSSSSPPDPTPTLGAPTTPTPGGDPTPTYGIPVTSTPPPTPPPTPTPGPPPTPTDGVPPGVPTPTPTPNDASPYPEPCGNRELLVSYNGTAKLISNVAATAQLFDGNIFSNGDVTFEINAAIANNATGTVYARSNFNNAGTSVNALSSLTNASLFYGGSYVKAPLDAVTHLLGCGILGTICNGVHFNTVPPRHGTLATIPWARPWRPNWRRLERFANEIVNEDSQPFGSWHAASGTWIVSGYDFPAGTQTLYYVDGNVQLGGVRLFRTASPRIFARGWISLTSLTVLSVGLLAGDAQSIVLVGERDVMIGRDVVNLAIPTWEAESTVLSLARGVNLATALDHRLNVMAVSQRGEVWGMVSNLSALSRPRLCLLGNQNATLAFTGTLAATTRSLN